MALVKVNNVPKTWGSLLDTWFNEIPAYGKDALAQVPVNIHETKDAYHLEVSTPGLKKEDINISIEKGLLTVSYEKKEVSQSEDYKTIRREFGYESFKRSFTLNDKVNADAIQAKYEDGILKVFIPKKEDVQPASKQIAIS